VKTPEDVVEDLGYVMISKVLDPAVENQIEYVNSIFWDI
jgi:hypothetical protein